MHIGVEASQGVGKYSTKKGPNEAVMHGCNPRGREGGREARPGPGGESISVITTWAGRRGCNQPAIVACTTPSLSMYTVHQRR